MLNVVMGKGSKTNDKQNKIVQYQDDEKKQHCFFQNEKITFFQEYTVSGGFAFYNNLSMD